MGKHAAIPSIVVSGVPSQNKDAEMSLLGCMLLSKSAIESAYGIVNSDDFYVPAHKIICQTCYDLYSTGQPVDILIVDSLIIERGQNVGGIKYLAKLLDDTIGISANAGYYAKIVRDCARRRGLAVVAEQMMAAANDNTSDPDEFATLAQHYADAIRQGRAEVRAAAPRDYIDDYLNGLRELQSRDGLVGIQTPFTDLNFLIGGLMPGEIIVLGGTPGTGKTALALNIATHAALNGHATAIISMEMLKENLTNRFFASCAGVNAQCFRNGRFNESDWAAINSFADTMKMLPLMLCDKPSLKPSDLYRLCRDWQQSCGLDLLIVDYLQLMGSDVKDAKSREREVASISRAIKQLALEFKIPVLVLAQLNREAIKGGGKPQLHHLRESGAIEQDADIVMFICPWDATEDQKEVIKADLVVRKGRSSGVGEFSLAYRRNLLRFENFARG